MTTEEGAREEKYGEPAPRLAVRMPARISTIDAETDPFSGRSYYRTCEETCANVSRGGAFVPMRETVAPGRRLLMELVLPGGQQVQVLARVVWTRTAAAAEMPAGSGQASGIGVEFVAGHRDDLAALVRFVERSLRSRRMPLDSNSAAPVTDPA